MDFSKFANDPLTDSHLLWLGFKNNGGVFTSESFDGKVKFTKGNYWYYKDGMMFSKLVVNKDIDELYLGIKINDQVPVRSEPKVGRNTSCSCGSGKKYKHCCLKQIH